MTKDEYVSDAGQLGDLQDRYQKLRDRKIQADSDLKHARERLEELKAQAREAYGTDDPEQLQAQLDKLVRENQSRREEYRARLDGIEKDLAAVEQAHRGTRQGG